jgi:cell division protein FtsI (penicillin-binding protein 3)
MKKTGLRGDEPDDNEWVEMSVSGNKVSSVSKSMAANQVPDVRGMGLKDAMFLLENKGFRVQVKGRGVVRTQSIPAGVPARKHMVILLELA